MADIPNARYPQAMRHSFLALAALALMQCSPLDAGETDEVVARDTATNQVTARYRFGAFETNHQLGCTVEVDGLGKARFQPPLGASYTLLRDGQFYLVNRTLDGDAVVRGEHAIEGLQRFNAVLADTNERVDEDKWRVVGDTEIEGRGGSQWEYVLTLPSEGLSDYPELVLADDPRLAPLGAAFASADRFHRLALAGCMSGGNPYYWPDALAEAGPLVIENLHLVEVSFAPIDPARFELPSEPISRESYLAVTTPYPSAPALD